MKHWATLVAQKRFSFSEVVRWDKSPWQQCVCYGRAESKASGKHWQLRGDTWREREEIKRCLNGAGGGVEGGRSRVSWVSSAYNKLIWVWLMLLRWPGGGGYLRVTPLWFLMENVGRWISQFQDMWKEDKKLIEEGREKVSAFMPSRGYFAKFYLVLAVGRMFFFSGMQQRYELTWLGFKPDGFRLD